MGHRQDFISFTASQNAEKRSPGIELILVRLEEMTQDYPAGHSRMMSLLSHGGSVEADSAPI